MPAADRPVNRLARESSPYLRQHAGNPVDWYPWGPEALARAKAEQKPIFLSIGYSACHWCHVMEHESFEDEETARLLNEGFVSIKVDREERPDLDQIYMAAVTALTQRGGWPMSVFLTPDLKPFFAGTYFPVEDRYGMPSFKRVLAGVLNAWQNRRDEVVQNAENLTNHLRELAVHDGGEGELDESLLRHAGHYLARACDRQHGGFGHAPKFPHPLEIKLLLRLWRRFGDDDALEMARITLDRMARGGIYDHLGGGFARYSTDAFWLVPHFEKMLYDNALLSQAYLEAYQAAGDDDYRQVIAETLGWVEREMTSPEGGFFSTLDADSEGVEGKYYVWSLAEIRSALSPEDFETFAYAYDLSEEGNWEGVNVLHRTRPWRQDARLLGMEEKEFRQRIDAARARLFALREKRVRPGLDDKIITSWNGLMINAFALAGQVLDARYVGPAQRAAEFLWRTMRRPDGRLFRTCSPGHEPKLNAYLEDYAFTLDAFVTLYESTFDPVWIERAESLAAVLLEQFWDDEAGGFFIVGKDHEELILRAKDAQDNAVPSGASLAINGLQRLGKLTGKSAYGERAERTLRLVAGPMAQSPMAFGQMLACLDFHLGPVDEVAIVGRGDAAETLAVLAHVRQSFQPRKVMAFLDLALPEAEQRFRQERIPLLAHKTASGGQTTTYVCRDFTCQAPLAGVEALRENWLKLSVRHSPA